jgi:hypothetical protein
VGTFKGFTLILDNGAELLDLPNIDADLGAFRGWSRIQLRHLEIVTEPEMPVEDLDTGVTIFNDSVDRSESLIRAVIELQNERHCNIAALLINVNEMREVAASNSAWTASKSAG